MNQLFRRLRRLRCLLGFHVSAHIYWPHRTNPQKEVHICRRCQESFTTTKKKGN